METIQYSRSQSRVDAVRNRLRLLSRGAGIVAMAGAIGVVYAILVLVDSQLRFEMLMRFVMLAAFIAAAVFVVRRWLLPSLRPVSLAEASHAIERTHPHLRGRLVTAVELGPRSATEEPGISRPLLEEVIRKAEEAAGGVDIKTAAPVEPHRRLLTWGGLGIVAFLVWAMLMPGAIGTGAPRLFAPWSSAAWPHKVRIFVDAGEQTKDGMILVPRGGTLLLNARAEGEFPSSGILRVRSTGDRATASRSRFDISEEGGIEIRFRPVVTDIEVRLEVGDAATDYIPVTMVPPPEVEAITVRSVYPAYTGLEPRETPDGNIEALFETEVTVRIGATKELSKAVLVWEDGTTLPMEIRDATGADVSFKVTQTTTYQIMLTDTLGFSSDAPITYRVSMNDNEYPVLDNVFPSRDKDITANAVIPLSGRVTDDYSLNSVHVRYRIGDGGVGSTSMPITHGIKQAEVSLAWDITPLAVKTGDTIEWWLEALDEGGHAEKQDPSTSTRRKLTIVDPSALVKKLTERTEQILQRLTALEQIQQACSDDVNRVEDQVASATAIDILIEELQPANVQQEQIRRNTILLADLLNEVIQDYEISRVGNEQRLEALRSTHQNLDALAVELMPQANQRLADSVAALRAVKEGGR